MSEYPLYRDTLCPKMWHMDEDGYRLDGEVRRMLLKVATDFVTSLKNDHELNVKIHDLVIIGSVANYNWTDYSDIDLHIVVDFSDLEMNKDDAQTMFDAIKTSWNLKHDIKMKGHDVELYVQDIDHEAVSTAEYSVLNSKWIKEPKKEDPKFNKKLIKRKYKEYKKQISDLVKNKDEAKLKKLLEKLYQYRQAGLDAGGELSEENIVFKILRAFGHLDKLKDGINKIYDKKMSVKEIAFNYAHNANSNDREYQQGLKIVARTILKAAEQYGKFPDINPLLELLSREFNKDIDDVYMDIAREIHRMTKSNLSEGASDIAKSVYQHAINTHQHFDRNGNSATMYGIPTPNQMKYLKGKSGNFIFGTNNTRVYFINDPYEQNKIKFTWNF